MEKLSSILPASPRVKSVDTSDSAPARPGAPAIGRPAGRNTVKDRLSISADAKEMAYKQTMSGRDPEDVSRAKLVSEINRKFFDTRLNKPVAIDQTVSGQVVQSSFDTPDSELSVDAGQNLDTQA